MNVAIIFNCLSGGGAERVAGDLSIYLSQYYNVYLFLEDVSNIVYEYNGELVDCGKDGGDYLEYNVGAAKRKYDIDVSISFMEPFNYINIRTSGKDAVIISERCYQSLIEPREWLYVYLNKQLYPLANNSVSISEGVRKELLESTAIDENKISTIYNFFDIDKIRTLSLDNDHCADENLYDPRKKYIVTIGRLTEQKDHIRLIRQFKYVYEKDDTCRLLIIGSGSMEKKLRNEAEKLSLKDVCVFIPYTKNPFWWLKRADVFVLPSRYEGYGNVILEAMALGIPVVAVDCPAGPREIMDDNADYSVYTAGWRECKRGILVTRDEGDRDGNTNYLADAIQHLLNNENLRSKIVERATYWIEEYSNEKILQEWKECIFKAIENKKNEIVKSFPRIESGNHYVIYGTGEHAKKVYTMLDAKGVEIDAFVISKNKESLVDFLGKPVYEKEYILENRENIKIIMGIADFTYANQVCKWFLDNKIDNVVFCPLSKE